MWHEARTTACAEATECMTTQSLEGRFAVALSQSTGRSQPLYQPTDSCICSGTPDGQKSGNPAGCMATGSVRTVHQMQSRGKFLAHTRAHPLDVLSGRFGVGGVQFCARKCEEIEDAFGRNLSMRRLSLLERNGGYLPGTGKRMLATWLCMAECGGAFTVGMSRRNMSPGVLRVNGLRRCCFARGRRRTNTAKAGTMDFVSVTRRSSEPMGFAFPSVAWKVIVGPVG